jgi:hypothetical protein
MRACPRRTTPPHPVAEKVAPWCVVMVAEVVVASGDGPFTALDYTIDRTLLAAGRVPPHAVVVTAKTNSVYEAATSSLQVHSKVSLRRVDAV